LAAASQRLLLRKNHGSALSIGLVHH
jgi:hypothetical protein